MRKAIAVIIVFCLAALFYCTKKEVDQEPDRVLQKWARAIEKLDYYAYKKCEAFPKAEAEFRLMYKDDYFVDIMVFEVGDPEEEDVLKDYKGDPYIKRNVLFDGAVTKRGTTQPYQIVRGDVVFIKYIDGDKKADGWLISNRTIVRYKK